MRPLLLPMPGNEAFAQDLAAAVDAVAGKIECRRFPDGESYVRLVSPVGGCSVAIVATLADPDANVPSLMFAADAARELGAARVGLVAPYLAYMRQDARFKPGEAVTSGTFARLLARSFDWLVTVDPHLHRRATLAEIYTIPAIACAAAPAISAWIRASIAKPLVIGPDSESRQWASAIAAAADAPCVTLDKIRHADREVEIAFPPLDAWRGRTAVIVDDIISTGRTMEVALRRLADLGFVDTVLIGVHGLLVGDARQRLMAAGAACIATTNTVPNPTSAIDVTGIVAAATRRLLRPAS